MHVNIYIKNIFFRSQNEGTVANDAALLATEPCYTVPST